MNYADGSRYWGDWKLNKPCGYGNLVMADKSSYSGGFDSEGAFHGKGQFIFPNQESYYLGNWSQGKKSGHGRFVYS